MLLSSFTGLAYVDTMLLHPHHIGRTADGRRYIRINRKKTNVEAFIPLQPIAEQENGTKSKNCQKKQTLITSKMVNDNNEMGNNHNQ